MITLLSELSDYLYFDVQSSSPSIPSNVRLLEDGTPRILEDTTFRILES